MARRRVLTDEQRAAHRAADHARTSAMNNHVHSDVTIREIRKSVEDLDVPTDPVRGSSRVFFNLGNGCRQVPNRRPRI